jgi:hypothetical protein
MSYREPDDGHAHCFEAVCLACGSTAQEVDMDFKLVRVMQDGVIDWASAGAPAWVEIDGSHPAADPDTAVPVAKDLPPDGRALFPIWKGGSDAAYHYQRGWNAAVDALNMAPHARDYMADPPPRPCGRPHVTTAENDTAAPSRTVTTEET